jgi:hypothetical protein
VEGGVDRRVRMRNGSESRGRTEEVIEELSATRTIGHSLNLRARSTRTAIFFGIQGESGFASRTEGGESQAVAAFELRPTKIEGKSVSYSSLPSRREPIGRAEMKPNLCTSAKLYYDFDKMVSIARQQSEKRPHFGRRKRQFEAIQSGPLTMRFGCGCTLNGKLG